MRNCYKQSNDAIILHRSRGALVDSRAEIKPVEPDQDNACAGKDEYLHSILSCFCKPGC